MIHAPHILLIGASGQNQGKSTLACRLIARHAAEQQVVGAKITTIRERNGECPRGGVGCGVCANLEGDWELSEERGDNPEKDTGRLLAAGADQVFWLRVCQARLAEGVQALLDRVGNRPLVCEGNSPRLVLEPGVFLVTRDRAPQAPKPSASAVQHHMDQAVTFDGTDFDLPLGRIALQGNRWTLQRDATAVIVAGGHSHRMGRDKSLLDVGGQPLIAHIAEQLRPHFDELLVSANDAGKYAFLRLPIVPDRQADQGPLMGIASALAAARHDRVFVTATDIPDPAPALMATLLRRARHHDAAVPRLPNGWVEPLFAVYCKTFGAVAAAALADGERKVRAALGRCDVAFVDVPAEAVPVNLNTPEDLAHFRSAQR